MMGDLVVGVDGSDGARAALRFAVDEARLRDARLRVVTAWHVPVLAYGGGIAPPPLPDMGDDLESAARASVENALAGVASDGVEIETVVREGRPVEVLLEEAEGADLLIVGSRGLGGFGGLLLGSVSAQCAQHAHCPVVIVRGDGR